MILYNANSCQNFLDYGIEVPIVSERESKVFQAIYNEYPEMFSLAKDYDVLPIEREDLIRVHKEDFINRLYSKEGLDEEMNKCFDLYDENMKPVRFNKLKQTKSFDDLFLRLKKQCRLSFMAMQKSLLHGFSYHLGGGMHHAMSFSGRGFCLLNDSVIGIRKLQHLDMIKNAWIVDVDAHKGDGASELCFGDKSIQTFSIHMAKGWPLDGDKIDEKGNIKPSFLPSDVDVEVNVQEEYLYLDKLKEGLENLYKKSGQPDLVVIVQGADPYEYDELEGTAALKLTQEQMLERDKLVYNFFAKKKIPQTYVMGGGYGKNTWKIYTQFLRFVFATR